MSPVEPDERPDPQALLAQVHEAEARARRGRLKIFFGACAGVGKTYAMLAAARSARQDGVPLVIGVVETHGRRETEAMLGDLPRLPMRQVPHRDRTLPAFDLDAALAFGAQHPQALVLLDELAFSNPPGARHPKRWQDVEELLAAGIDVWSTVNVQHLESLNDVVAGITGVAVRETVPDRVFDQADEVVVVDLPPDELIERLRDGKVYLPAQAQKAAVHFFRKGNLLALRELALRRTADRVDDEMQAYRRTVRGATVWANREALLAAVGPGEAGEKVVRSCARLAARLELPWQAVLVETPELLRQPERRREQALRVLRLAQELGATTATLSAPSVAQALVRHARTHNLSRIVVGRGAPRAAWRRWWRPPIAQAIAALATDLDVLQVATGHAGSRREPAEEAAAEAPTAWTGYAAAVAACLLTAAVAAPLHDSFELTNIVMLFLLAVVGVALRFGRGPAVLAAFLGVGVFDFFFVQPRFSFAVSDVQYLVTFGVMLVVALAIGTLTAGLTAQADAATRREQRVRSLYEMSRDLSAALMPEQVAEIGARFIAAEFGAGCTLLAADEADQLQALPGGQAAVDAGVAQWSFDRGEAAGFGTGTLPASRCLVLPLKAPMRVRGVLAIEPRDRRALGPEQRRLLDTCASLLAISLERIHYIAVAQASTVQIESERLRNSLLSAISHDLRTPLAALVGMADTLATLPPDAAARDEAARAIRDSATRMGALVDNLLDMARLQAGAVQLHRAWLPLDEVIGSARAAAAASLAGRPLQVMLPPEPPLVALDAVLFERVLVNLLENAAKYTPAGSALRLMAQVQPEAIVLVLDDDGPGLPPGREESLFEKFERGQREGSTPGVGLGLAICRAIVEAHGGRIVASNRQEAGAVAGARFTITLPRGTPPSDDGSGAVSAAG